MPTYILLINNPPIIQALGREQPPRVSVMNYRRSDGGPSEESGRYEPRWWLFYWKYTYSIFDIESAVGWHDCSDGKDGDAGSKDANSGENKSGGTNTKNWEFSSRESKLPQCPIPGWSRLRWANSAMAFTSSYGLCEWVCIFATGFWREFYLTMESIMRWLEGALECLII